MMRPRGISEGHSPVVLGPASAVGRDFAFTPPDIKPDERPSNATTAKPQIRPVPGTRAEAATPSALSHQNPSLNHPNLTTGCGRF